MSAPRRVPPAAAPVPAAPLRLAVSGAPRPAAPAPLRPAAPPAPAPLRPAVLGAPRPAAPAPRPAAAPPALAAPRPAAAPAPRPAAAPPAALPAPAAPEPSDGAVLAEVGRLGVTVALAALRERAGGEAPFRRLLAALTVTARPLPGRPRGMGPADRRAAYLLVTAAAAGRDGGAPPAPERLVVLPRGRLPALLAPRPRPRGAPPGPPRPLLDGVRPGRPGGPNPPHPPPRRLDPAACECALPLFPYQEVMVAHLVRLFAGAVGDVPLAGGGSSGGGAPAGGGGGGGGDGGGGLRGAPARDARDAPVRPGVAYLQMATGLGKSRVGGDLIVRRGGPGLVVVPTDAIAVQWVDVFAEAFPGLRVAVFRNPPKGSRRPPPSPATHDVLVVIVNTFRDKEPEFLEGFATVVLDEAHEYHSRHNSRALWLAAGAPAALGLSATPLERPDGMDAFVPLLLGGATPPEAVPGFDVGAVCFRGAVRALRYAGHPDFCRPQLTPAGTSSAILTVVEALRDPFRLRLVAAEALRLLRLHETLPPAERAAAGLGVPPGAPPGTPPRRHGVFVFAETREYLPRLREALLAAAVAPEEICAPELAEEGADAPAPGPPDEADGALGEADDAPDELGADNAPGGLGADDAPGGPGAEGGPGAVSILRGGVAKTAVGDARRAGAHIVLTTFGYSRRGISLVDMTAIVLASPRRNGSRQILGRILRRGSDESIVRQVVDIVDVNTGLKSQYADRRKVYREKEYPESVAKVSWADFPGGGAPPAAPAAGPNEGADSDDELAGLDSEALLRVALGDG